VIFREQIDQQFPLLLVREADREPDLARLGVEIVHEQYRVVPPVVTKNEDGRIGTADHRELAPTHFQNLLAHADDPLGPVEERIRMAPLDRGINVLEAVGPARDHRQPRPVALGEAAVRFIRPLHGRSRAVALRQFQIIAHADLVAVTNDRGARQSKHARTD
jgi:hypothetical protein